MTATIIEKDIHKDTDIIKIITGCLFLHDMIKYNLILQKCTLIITKDKWNIGF